MNPNDSSIISFYTPPSTPKMNSQASPILLLLFFMCLVLVQIPPSLSSSEQWFTSCSKLFNCGNITGVDYPFWGGDRRDGCGYPGLKLNCDCDIATIQIMNVKYRVLDINLDVQVLKIAREDYLEGICPSQFVNITLDSNLFEYAPGYMNLMLLYGCPPVRNLGFNISSCAINGLAYEGVLVKLGSQGPGECNTSVIVPVVEMGWQDFTNSSDLVQLLLGKGFEVKWKVDGKACSECTTSMGKCGYDFHLNQTTCFCPGQPLGSTTCPSSSAAAGDSSGLNLPTKIAVGISASAAGAIIVSIVVICCLKRKHISAKAMVFWKKGTKNDQNDKAFIRNYGSPLKRYSYSDVKKMTRSFKEKIGQGGYGAVYKGKLSNGRLVAVKVLSESKGNGEELMNEVASISRTNHVNVVALLGVCYERTKSALIYEFMPNGSLDRFIYDKGISNANRHLEWKTLYQIAMGIAQGLDYLHRGCRTTILHFDIKPHNILLDEDFRPKISDFGLSKLCQRRKSVSMLGTRGTAGYIAPEVFNKNFGGISHKSDVYSYGMMILEMVGGRKNIDPRVSRTSEIYFPHWIYDHLEVGEDLKLNGVMTKEEEEMARKMILVSMCCIQTIPSDRPSMAKVVMMLEGSLQSLQIPPKPVLSSPPRSPLHSSTTSLS